jgi:peptide-methionine (S)-S-oxide reductase
MARAIATLAGGCFWCLETVFNRLQGVESAISGYMGGQTPNPTYRDVCDGDTGHAEVVQVTFDPDVISFRDLLDVFFTIHDPTQLNRQGNDVGTQYRSAIFCHTPEQKAEAEVAIAELNASKKFAAPIVTEGTEAATFYPAEAYHQRYYEQNPHQPYCQFVVAPKVAKAEAKFAERLKKSKGAN